MKTKQVLSLAASAMTKGSSNLTDKSHFSFSNFSLSKGGCVWGAGGGVGGFGWLVCFDILVFHFLSPGKFQLLHSVLLFLCA